MPHYITDGDFASSTYLPHRMCCGVSWVLTWPFQRARMMEKKQQTQEKNWQACSHVSQNGNGMESPTSWSGWRCFRFKSGCARVVSNLPGLSGAVCECKFKNSNFQKRLTVTKIPPECVHDSPQP